MIRRLQSTLLIVGALAVVATARAALHAQSHPGLTVVLWIDVTISTTEAMSVFVWDDGVPRAQRGIFKGTKTPATLGDAFSTAVKDGFIDSLGRDDRARIGSIARTRLLSPAFASDHGALGRALGNALNVRREDRYGPSPLWDAIVDGIASLDGESGRRAIILVTDGMATGNSHPLDEVIAQAKRAGVSVSVVCEAWGPFRSNQAAFHIADVSGATWNVMHGAFGKPPEANLERLTAGTGGVFISDGGNAQTPDPGARLKWILGELRR